MVGKRGDRTGRLDLDHLVRFPPMSHGESSQQRQLLGERFAITPIAYSSNGHDVGFAGPVELGVEVGGMAIVDLPDDAQLVVQVRDLRVVEREALTIDVDVSGLVPGATAATVRPMFHSLSGSGIVLGRTDASGFTALSETTPFGERPIRAAAPAELSSIIDALDGDGTTVDIGTVAGTDAPARLRATGFARHTFMCGQSGSGKTYTTGVLFERLLAATTLPIVVLDPNSDHVHLGALQHQDDVSANAERYRKVAPGVAVARARGLDAAYTLCADFSDVPLEVQARLLRLDPIDDLDGYASLRRLTGALGASYSIADVAAAATRDPATADLATRIENLQLASWSLWRQPGETSIASVDVSDARCVVLDLGSLPDPKERSIVALAVLARRWARRGERRPVLLAIDEAHNVFPAATDDPMQQAAADLGVLIAGEGRKFGLHLLVATQRPSKVHPNVVSQCDNLVLMRMNGGTDIDELASLFSHVPSPLMRRALAFRLGRALVAGPISPVPRVVEIGGRLTPEGGGDVPTTWAAPT